MSERNRRRPAAAVPAALAAAIAVVALAAAITVRNCPRIGGCHWDPGFGIAAVVMGAVAASACAGFARRVVRGTDDIAAILLLAASIVGVVIWCIAFYTAIA